jgi:hypothetical protein
LTLVGSLTLYLLGLFPVISLEEALSAAAHCLRTQRPQKAEEIAQLTLGLLAPSPDAAILYGSALMAQGRVQEASAIFEDTLRRNDLRRWHILQIAVARLNAATYLEIGVADGANILRVAAPVRIGVDPVAPAPLVAATMPREALTYYARTSDEFFRSPPPDICSSGIDIAFVDGLHTYRQALVDVENCLQYLNHGGLIFVHDCNPFSAAMAVPAASLDEARRRKPPGWNNLWTGDVWKAILHLRSCRSDLNVGVVDCDFGIGVVMRASAAALLPYSPEDIQRLSYDELAASRREFLGLFPAHELLARLQRAGA